MSGSDTNLPIEISLDGVWEFSYTPQAPEDGAAPPSPESYQATMPVPGYWDNHLESLRRSPLWFDTRANPSYRPIVFPMGSVRLYDASLPYLVGCGWYRRVFQAPADWGERHVSLRVGRVSMRAWIWLNGEMIHYNYGHSARFEASLDSALRPGEANELVIAVANHEERWGCEVRGFKGSAGGVTRSVSLRVTGRPYLADAYVYPTAELDRLVWRAEIPDAAELEDLSLRWRVVDPQSAACLGDGEESVASPAVEFSTETCGMKPWSDTAPSLYRVELELTRGAVILDRYRRSFGLRRLERDGVGLRLNGAPTYLRGTTDHCYFPKTCFSPADVAEHRERFRILKRMGYNWVRCHTWTPSSEFFQAADEVGMMVQIEPPRRYTEQEWLDILRACREHPSVVIYCLGNEEYFDDKMIDKARRMAELQKRHVPDALFCPQEAIRGVEYYYLEEDQKDLVHEPFEHNPRKLDPIREFTDCFGQFPQGLVNSIVGGWRELDRRLEIYRRPCLSHELGISGTFIDLDLEDRYEGTLIGTNLYAAARAHLREAGALERAPLYYRNSCRWQRLMVKHAMEKSRLCRFIAGYDHLGAFDQQWHRCGYPCGIMNEFFEEKPGWSAEEIRKYNDHSVLLLDVTNERNLRAGESRTMDLFVSWFAERDFEDGILSWTIEDQRGHIRRRERLSAIRARRGEITRLAGVELEAPETDEPLRLTVRARLASDVCEIVNDWDYWSFPEPSDETKSAPVADLRVVGELGEDEVRALEKGERFLLLGTGPFDRLGTTFQGGWAGRAHMVFATVLADHPVWGSFPHEGFCDWQFYSMLEHGQSVCFEDTELPFDPLLEMAPSFKWFRKQAAVFELRVGAGRLLVCSLNLRESDPAARWMFHCLLDYGKSAAFEPRHEIAPETLRRQIARGGRDLPTQETDSGLDPNAARLFEEKQLKRR